jgi:hypothetical protein
VLLAGKLVLIFLQVALDHFGIDFEDLCQGFASFYCPMLIVPEDIVFRCFRFVFSRLGFFVKISISDGFCKSDPILFK